MKYLFLFLFVSCGGSGVTFKPIVAEQQNIYETSANYFSKSKEVIVEVAYTENSVPYTGETSNQVKRWQILEENINHLFLGRDELPLVTVPKELGEMNLIEKQEIKSWTVNDLLNLSVKYRKGESSENKSYFWIVFLEGFFHQDGQDYDKTLGVSIGNTTIIAIFKDVINNSSQTEEVKAFVEQATLVHEMGHALGLVQTGVPVTSDHHDEDHQGHCTNQDCVMYYLNEGANDVPSYISRFVSSGSLVMFGQECIDDTKSYDP